MKLLLFISFSGSLPAAAGCIAIESERILARDLARADPRFGELPPEEPVAWAPAPGARLLLRASRLARLASRHEAALLPPPADVCFEYPAAPLDRGPLLDALGKTLADPGARIELVDFSRHPVPRGAIEFLMGGLQRSKAPAPQLWRGAVRYHPRKTIPIWARVRILAFREQVMAARDLDAGRAIPADGLVIRRVEASPLDPPAVSSVEAAAGRRLRRTIRAGEPVYAGMLAPAVDVERGDTVQVEVSSGAARLTLAAVAESGGVVGDRILLRNPLNGGRLLARIEGPGKARVIGAGGRL